MLKMINSFLSRLLNYIFNSNINNHYKYGNIIAYFIISFNILVLIIGIIFIFIQKKRKLGVFLIALCIIILIDTYLLIMGYYPWHNWYINLIKNIFK